MVAPPPATSSSQNGCQGRFGEIILMLDSVLTNNAYYQLIGRIINIKYDLVLLNYANISKTIYSVDRSEIKTKLHHHGKSEFQLQNIQDFTI